MCGATLKRTLSVSLAILPLTLLAQTEVQPLTGISLTGVLRGMLGLAVLVGIAYLFSSNRKQVSWKLVGMGLLIQLLTALSILYIPAVQWVFDRVGKVFVAILEFTQAGSTFLFGSLMNVDSFGFVFALQILPTIMFFSALTSVLFYLGVIQKVVKALAWALTKALGISGAESLSVAGNIFLGQTESPLMIKAYLENMNRSEILLVMIGGMATVAGGVLAAYVGFLSGGDEALQVFYAKHLLTASVMAAPGAIVISKILVPQTEAIDEEIKITQESVGSNFLDAMSNGTSEGLKLAANVGAMLLVFFAFIAMFNGAFGWLGGITGLNGWVADVSGGSFDSLSLEFLLGYLFAPLMWLIGVATEDITLLGRLLGEKIIASEFVGYASLADLKDARAISYQRSIVMATYMLCGFANFASIGIQIGGIGSLAPGKRTLLSEFGMKALLGGSIASLVSATMVGMLV
jgi:CNT family concentrative nucleoside transporter